MSSADQIVEADAAPTGQRPTVTLAALFGAGGDVVGARVAEQLGVPLLDREIPADVAKRAGLPEEAIVEVDEEPRSVSESIVERLGRAATVTGEGQASRDLDRQARRLRGYVEEHMTRASAGQGGVVIGRGGMVVLRSVPWALHVYLRGAPQSRVEQAMKLEGIGRAEAERRRRSEDRARVGYVERAYGVDGHDPSLYHLVLDSTALGLAVCVELIVTAARDRVERPRPSRPA